MAIPDAVLSAVVSEEQQLASIISSEAIKASTTAAWISSITLASLLAETGYQRPHLASQIF